MEEPAPRSLARVRRVLPASPLFQDGGARRPRARAAAAQRWSGRGSACGAARRRVVLWGVPAVHPGATFPSFPFLRFLLVQSS